LGDVIVGRFGDVGLDLVLKLAVGGAATD